jgi:hypothetical protein
MARKLPELTAEQVVEALGYDSFEDTAKQCHGVSLGLVRAGLPQLKGGRVARGWAKGVGSQHSWITLGDPYDAESIIVDATLWSYDPSIHGVAIWPGRSKRYMPHGAAGTIWEVGSPPPAQDDELIMELPHDEYENLSDEAKHFLKTCGPLDIRGWSYLGNAPVRGWPSGEIFTAIWNSRKRELRAMIPIDRFGMCTDVNPGGAYF